MPTHFSTTHHLLLVTVLIGLWAPVAGAQQPLPAVSVMPAEKRVVSAADRFVGRVDAIERVDIRARVTGFLEEVLFKDGDSVKTGSPLYRIEKAPFEAAVDQARAGLLRARAQFDNTTVQRKRAEELLRTNAASQAILDDRIMSEKVAQGEVAAAEATLKTAEINLAYTDITSPIGGRVGRTAVTRGNVVGPNSGVLTTIVNADPMYVTFPVSQREILNLAERRKQQGQTPTPARDEFKATVLFSNGQVYPHPGRIDFVDVKVDRGTDTIAIRATIPNPDGMLVDGQLVQVSVEVDRPIEHVLVPQAALLADQQGPYVFIVEDGKVAIRRLKLGQNSGVSVIVTSGLNGGELIVLSGAQSLRPGAAVRALPAEKPLGG